MAKASATFPHCMFLHRGFSAVWFSGTACLCTLRFHTKPFLSFSLLSSFLPPFFHSFFFPFFLLSFLPSFFPSFFPSFILSFPSTAFGAETIRAETLDVGLNSARSRGAETLDVGSNSARSRGAITLSVGSSSARSRGTETHCTEKPQCGNSAVMWLNKKNRGQKHSQFTKH